MVNKYSGRQNCEEFKRTRHVNSNITNMEQDVSTYIKEDAANVEADIAQIVKFNGDYVVGKVQKSKVH